MFVLGHHRFHLTVGIAVKRIAQLLSLSLSFIAGPALAAEEYAHPWQLGLQHAATPVMEQLTWLHNYFLIIITLITIFVMILLAYVCVRFSRKNNPVPSTTTHNTLLEIVWTSVPVLILIAMAIPSLKTHYFMDTIDKAELTLKVTGRQWYWEYAYPDNGGFSFESRIKEDKDLAPGEHRLLAVDNHVVVPVDTVVRVEITAADVIHSWAMPSFGIKTDAVPGRLNETWFKAIKTGTFYGQCSELCGVGHGFMPIMVEVVSKEAFAAWVEQAKQKFAQNGAHGLTVALNH